MLKNFQKKRKLNLKKMSENQFIDKIISNLPSDNNKCYINHKKGIYTSTIRKDRNQSEKEKIC